MMSKECLPHVSGASQGAFLPLPLLLLLSLLLLVGESPAGAEDATPVGEDNSCVACHRLASTARKLPQDQFMHWYGSVHGEAGVTCDQCHGGNPASAGKWRAHMGVQTSHKRRSTLYYKNVPQTCGECHDTVYKEFVESRHYKELISDRLAPSCTTCHGFEMDVRAVTPAQIVSRCVLCHSEEGGVKPAVLSMAQEAVEAIAATRTMLDETEVTLALARERGLETGEAEALWREAREQLGGTGAYWHSFRLSAFKWELGLIRKKAEKAQTLVRDAHLAK